MTERTKTRDLEVDILYWSGSLPSTAQPESHLRHLQVDQLWISYVSALYLSFFICKRGTVIISNSQGHYED